MRRLLHLAFLSLLIALYPLQANSQISQNKNKFLGNITTYGQMDTDGYLYRQLWNQVTPENETKWSSVEGNRGVFNWGGADVSYNYAKNHGLHFKFHCFAWGSQYPNWITSLDAKERYDEIVKWIDEAKKHYPNLELIDVVNEALSGHQQGTHYFEEALGGSGQSGYDWIVNAFELVHERWPDAILIYNDFNTFQHDTDRYIKLVQSLIDAGAPIDAYGCQSHDLNDMSGADLQKVMTKIQDSLRIPMYISEYDIDKADDAVQKTRYQEQIPLMWESDYCAGVTIWGFIQGKTWESNSGISYRSGNERPAMKWLREYMATEKAINAGFRKNFPLTNGWTKEASVYVKPSKLKPSLGDEYDVTVRASMKTKTIDHVVLYYDKDSVVMDKEPYKVTLKADKVGHRTTLKAIVYTKDSSAYTRYSHVEVYPERKPFKGSPAPLPGVIKAADYDIGGEGQTYHDSDDSSEGDYSSYRSEKAIDIVHGNGGAVIGYTISGEWMEYTVNVAKAGYYNFAAVASSGTTGSGFSISVNKDGELTELANISVPQTADNDWSVYTTITGRTAVQLEAGVQILRIAITGSSCNIDKVMFTHIDVNPDVKLKVTVNPTKVYVGSTVTVNVDVTKPEQAKIKSLDIFLDGDSIDSIKDDLDQYQYDMIALQPGEHTVMARASMADGSESDFFPTTFTAERKRAPFKAMDVPGIIEAEDFDMGGEGMSFHDSDANDEGRTGYRYDNEGLDITTGNGGYSVGYTVSGEWMEYTVNVTRPGRYKYEATVSSGATGAAFKIGVKNSDGTIKNLTTVNVGQVKPNDWETYTVKTGSFMYKLAEGEQVIRISITGSSCNIDKLKLICADDPSGVDATAETTGGRYEVYSLTGASAGQISVGSEEEIGSAIYQLTGRNGLFIVKNLETGKAGRYMAE